MTALARIAPRRSDPRQDPFETRRIVDGKEMFLASRGALRRVRLEARLTACCVAIALALGFAMSVRDHLRMRGCTMPRAEQTKAEIGALVHEALPQHLMQHPDRACPTLDELRVYTNRKDGRDAWGTPLYLHCRPGAAPGLHIVSAGPDQRFWTDDDLDTDAW